MQKVSKSLLKNRLKTFSAKIPNEMASKLLVRFLAGLESDTVDEDWDLATESVKDILANSIVYKGLDKSCKLTISVDDNSTSKVFVAEKIPFDEFMKELWEDMCFRDDQAAGPKVAKILEKWAKVFAGADKL